MRLLEPRDRLIAFAQKPRGGGREEPIYTRFRSGPLVPARRRLGRQLRELAEDLFPAAIPRPPLPNRPPLLIGDVKVAIHHKPYTQRVSTNRRYLVLDPILDLSESLRGDFKIVDVPVEQTESRRGDLEH